MEVVVEAEEEANTKAKVKARHNGKILLKTIEIGLEHAPFDVLVYLFFLI